MKKIFTILIGLLVSLSTTQAQSWDEIAKLNPTPYTTQELNNLGKSVDIDGDYAIVGEPGFDNGSGVALVYYNNAGTWEKIAILSAPVKNANDQFGSSVAIDGDIIVISVPFFTNTNKLEGIIYVYKKPLSGWEDTNLPSATLRASTPETYANMGYNIAIDGNNIIASTRKLKLYVYTKPTSGWADATETAVLTSTISITSSFGSSIDISADNIVVGDYQNYINGSRSGVAFIYSKPSSGWVDATEDATLLPTTGMVSAYFGISVKIENNIVVIGAPGDDSRNGSAYIFEEPISGWSGTVNDIKKITLDSPDTNIFFAEEVSINNNYIVIVAQSKSKYYIYNKGANWTDATLEATMTSSLSRKDQYSYGESMAFDGDNIFIGAPSNDENGYSSGLVYSYTKTTANWIDGNETQQITSNYTNNNTPGDLYGSQVDIDGDYAVVASPSRLNIRGSFYLLKNNSGTWVTIKEVHASNIPHSDGFASSIAISGNTIVVGAKRINRSQGGIYVYSINSSTDEITEEAFLNVSGITGYPQLGYSVDIFGDDIVAGAYKEDNGIGSVYIFSKPSSGWVTTDVITAKITSSLIVDNYSHFGSSVSINNNALVVGASDNTYNGIKSGTVHVYQKPVSGWVTTTTEDAVLISSDAKINDKLGNSVSIYGDDVVTGSILGSNGGENTGVAYVFSKPSSGWANSTETAKLTASDASNNDAFGHDVSIDNDRVIISSYNSPRDFSTNKVYYFEKPSSGWISSTENSIITSDNSVSGDIFGSSVALNGSNIIIGAKNDTGDTNNSINSGSAYIFNYSSSLSVNNNIFNNDFSLYPNPTTGLVTITHKNAKYITITDIKGIENNKVEVNLSDYNKGIYFVTIQGDNKTTTKKLLKK